MALVDFKQPLARYSGKVGSAGNGQVYYMLDDRGVARELVIPTNPNSTYQQTIRTIRASLGTQFAALNRTQAEAWILFAKNMKRKDRFGREYTFGGVQAFQAVNTHRALANETILSTPPNYVSAPPPLGVNSAMLIAPFTLTLELDHLQAAASGFWRVRLTPPIDTSARVARRGELRCATTAFDDAYVAIDSAPQSITLTTRFDYVSGEAVGIEVLGLSNDYIPGKSLFNPRIGLA